MQVSHIEDSVTHAIIGGQQAMAYTMDDSAEFFDVLFKALYSNPILASVRETLCNAWDAHIDSGRTDRPITITLSRDGELVIRDYGHGIPQSKVALIYCTAGRSTKTHDGKQTGGFGLGCKAPYAYADHMEVTIWNGGSMTIYRGSKSNAEVAGKPSFTPIVSVPCGDETGLQVKFQVQQKDIATFREYIRQIVANGEMNATLNGEELETLPFSQAPHGWMILQRKPIQTNAMILLRYGNVIYPVEDHPEYKSDYFSATHVLKKLAPQWGNVNWSLVLQAPPHSVAITPSRESLNMADITVATVQQLLKAFLERQAEETQVRAFELLGQGITTTVSQLKPHKLASMEKKVLSLPMGAYGRQADDPPHISTFDEFARVYTSHHYPEYYGFRNQDLMLRVKTLLETGYGGRTNRGKLQSFLEMLQLNNKKKTRKRVDRSWFQRRLIAPLVTGLAANPLLDPKRLLVYSADLKEKSGGRWGVGGWEEAHKWSPDTLESTLPFLRNFVILSYSRMDIYERAMAYPVMQFWLGTPLESLVYVAPRSEERVKAAREFFASKGLTIVDLTQRQAWEPAPEPKLATAPKKPKRIQKGLPLLSNLCLQGTNRIATSRIRNLPATELQCTETPEFLVKVAFRDNRDYLNDQFNDTCSRLIVRLFGSKGAVVVSESQAEKYKKAGAKDMTDWLWDHFAQEWEHNPRLRAYASYDPRLIDNHGLNWVQNKLLKLVMKDTILSTHLGVKDDRTEEDRMLSELFWEIAGANRYDNRPKIQKIKTIMLESATNPTITQLVRMLKDSALTGVVDPDGLETVLSCAKTAPQQKATARDLLIKVIEG